MKISCIVAMAKNRVIGKDNQIPWYLPEDLKHFKRITINHPIIMGRKCYESIGRPLPKRTNIIITRNPFFIVSNCLIANGVTEAIELAHQTGADEIFIIGGGNLYEQTIDLWDTLYLTEVDFEPEGDIFFPELDMKKWSLISEEKHSKNDKNAYDYVFKKFEKKVSI